MSGKLLLIYICNFHVLNHLLLIYICKLHWNLAHFADKDAAPVVVNIVPVVTTETLVEEVPVADIDSEGSVRMMSLVGSTQNSPLNVCMR